MVEMNKYKAKRTYSAFCGRFFSSKKEAIRGEELKALEMYGSITDLEYQKKFVLATEPYRVSITIDFAYKEEGVQKYEDTKGVLTRDFRSKLAWLKQLHGIEVELT